MLRPERMSKVSVTGSRAVLDDVIETVHDLNLVHLVDYDGRWDGFDNGDPIAGAEESSEKLVTVRSLESILDLEDEDVDPARSFPDDEDFEAELDRIRADVNELDDRRDDIRSELRSVEEEIDTIEVFESLDIDLDLLSGYETLDVAVGEGDEAAVSAALAEADDVEEFETFSGDGVVAIFARPAADAGEDTIEDALVGVNFAAVEVPDAEGSPAEYLAELRDRKRELESELETVESELEEIELDAADFLLAAEESLSIEVQKAEAPLQFATTKRSFIAEGWIPTERYSDLEMALENAVGDRVDLEELERASYDEHGHARDREGVHEGPHEGGAGEGSPDPVATDGAGDGEGHHDQPPVVQDNPEPVQPFEVLVNTVNRPKYTELDPTLIVFLTFPFAYGFMIGDIGYGLLYMAMGGVMYRYDSEVIRSLGIIMLWAGAFTTLFGYLYDDFFGVHMHDLGLHLPLAGTLNKGLHASDFALLWVIIAILFGLLHLTTGYVLGFINDRHHGLKEATLENLSWALALNGFFVWVFSAHLAGSKPDFLIGPGSPLDTFVGFAGFSETVGMAALGVALLGAVMVVAGEGGIGFVELPSLLANSLSYLRITAVLLAKAGMAFVVNLLVFGAYLDHEGHVAFGLPGYDVSGYEQEFVGLIHADPALVTIPVAILVFVLGHILVLLLGITAAGIQMIRLEYVEFFDKFYEGGGENYEPFGYQRTYTED